MTGVPDGRWLDLLKAIVPHTWWGFFRNRFYRWRNRRHDASENRRVTHRHAAMLVVSESERAAHAYHHWLAWLEASRPQLRAAIRLDRVPGARAGPARVLHAWVQDPVRERDAALFRQLDGLERAVLARGGVGRRRSRSSGVPGRPLG